MMPRSYWIFLAAMYSIVGLALVVSWRRRARLRRLDVFRLGHGAQRDAATAVLPPTLLAHETAGPGHLQCDAEMKDARWHFCGLDAGHDGDHRCVSCDRLFTGKVLLA